LSPDKKEEEEVKCAILAISWFLGRRNAMRQKDGRETSEDFPPPQRLVIVRPLRRSSLRPRDRQGELSVRVVFETNERYELRVGDEGPGVETGRHLFVPVGTRLVGTSTHIQPLFHTYHVSSGVTDWRIPTGEVTFTYISDEITEEGVQEDFAEESIAFAEDHAHPGGHKIAQLHYGRAIIALFVSGASDLVLADLWVKRALSLLEIRQVGDAIAELEAAANAYGEAMAQPRIRQAEKRLEYAERSVKILLLLAHAYLQAGDEQRAQSVLHRLLTINKGLKKRYESKARFLLHAAEFFDKRGDTEGIFPLLAQADRSYGQQLASLARLIPDI